MRHAHRTLVLASLILLGATPAAPVTDTPYLPADTSLDGVAILPNAPVQGSAAAAADRAIFRQTRKLKGTARWRVAIDDVENAPLDRYACAIGMSLSAKDAPATVRLLDKAGTGRLVDPVKQHYHRVRPWVGSGLPICEAKTAHLAANGDYPSGHAANGWLEALILAELLPNRASAILTRGRQYGESRVVCGSHSASAVSAGWVAGAAVFAALHGSATFRADLAAARKELAGLSHRAPHPDPATCKATARILAQAAW